MWAMRTRATAALLWFLAIWVGYEILWSIAGIPRVVGPVLGWIAAWIVVIDPVARLSGRSPGVGRTLRSGDRVEA